MAGVSGVTMAHAGTAPARRRLVGAVALLLGALGAGCSAKDQPGGWLHTTTTSAQGGSGGDGAGGYPAEALPDCAAGVPQGFVPETQGPDYVIVLESDELVEHRGDVRAMHGYSGEPPMVADIVITTGDYSDPQCEVWQSGHYYYWQGCNPQQGGIWNIHAVPTTQKIEDGIDELELWQNVSFFGFEVERIDYDDGSWWTDAGCNTLLIYWLCRNDT